MSFVRVGLLAWAVVRPQGLAGWAARLEREVGAAAAAGARLLLLPEYAGLEAAAGAQPDIAAELRRAVAMAPELLAAAQAVARRHGVWLVPGTLPFRDGARLINRAPLIAPDGAVAFQDKHVMTRFEAEEWGIALGAPPAVFATEFGRIGIAVCFDAEFPHLVRAQVEAGAWLILVPACTDSRAGAHRIRIACAARAMENQCFVATAPTVGNAPWCGALDANRGSAAAFGPVDRGFTDDGVIAAGAADAPGWIYADLDPARLEAVRRDGAVRNHLGLAAGTAALRGAHPRMTLVYLLAGEHSGDVLGARLMAALRAARPELHFAGIGGPRMAAEGLASLFPMQELAVMGLLEVLPRVLRLRQRMAETVADIAARRPDVLVTIDSPGFALRLLGRLRTSGIARVHYVAPQVWAWRESRVRHFPGLWDRLLCLLPFEVAFFAGHGLPASFVGHPVLESGADKGDAARFRARHALPTAAPVLVLMPGSRLTEAWRLLPVYGATVGLLARRFPGLVPVVPTASAVAEAVRRATAAWPVRPLIVTELDEKHDAYAAAAAALTKSGTSTLELALAGVPMAVTYRVNRLTGAIARRLIRVPHVAMANLLAGRAVVPELLQQECRPERLAATVAALIEDGGAAAAQRAAFREVMARLAPAAGTPSAAAAREVLLVLDGAYARP